MIQGHVKRVVESRQNGEAIEIRTVDGSTFVTETAEMYVHKYSTGEGEDLEWSESYPAVVLSMGDLQTTHVSCEHIVIVNIVHDPKTVYRARNEQSMGPR